MEGTTLLSILRPKDQRRIDRPRLDNRLAKALFIYSKKFQHGFSKIHLDPRLIRYAIELGLLDYARFVNWDETPIEARYLETGLLVNSIARIKPIQIATDANFTEGMAHVNAHYAFLYGEELLKIRSEAAPREYLRSVLIALEIGEFSGPGLAREFFLLEKLRP